MSIGEDRVRVKFNPSAKGLVDQLKQKSAELIDLCETHKAVAGAAVFKDVGEVNRLWALAQTYYEMAAMLAVKAATTEI